MTVEELRDVMRDEFAAQGRLIEATIKPISDTVAAQGKKIDELSGKQSEAKGREHSPKECPNLRAINFGNWAVVTLSTVVLSVIGWIVHQLGMMNSRIEQVATILSAHLAK